MENAASPLNIHLQTPSSFLPHSFNRYLHLSFSNPSSYFLPLKAEPTKGLNSPKSTDPSSPPSSPPSAGFGSPINDKKKNRKGKSKSAVVRRMPIEKPSIFSSTGDQIGSSQDQQGGASEGAFLLAWLGLGGLILIQGIALAASGFLPEQWDNFFVKYLYPSFTPTVTIFVGGTIVYGVYKFLQAEKMKG